MKNKKAFTLIEIVLVTLILGILTGVLFKTYITISQISFRVEQQKHVNQELLFVSETLQNLANRNEIDYEMYENLNDTKWFTDFLYLSGEDGNIKIYSSWTCLQDDFSEDNFCSLFLDKNWESIDLISNNVQTSKVRFKIIPYADNQSYLDDAYLCQSNYLACLNAQGFWIFLQLYAKWYNPSNWSTNVSLFIQQFFNI